MTVTGKKRLNPNEIAALSSLMVKEKCQQKRVRCQSHQTWVEDRGLYRDKIIQYKLK